MIGSDHLIVLVVTRRTATVGKEADIVSNFRLGDRHPEEKMVPLEVQQSQVPTTEEGMAALPNENSKGSMSKSTIENCCTGEADWNTKQRRTKEKVRRWRMVEEEEPREEEAGGPRRRERTSTDT